jgi:hypothetical protein
MTFVSSSGGVNNLGGDGMQPSDRRRHKYGETGKAGWYFWYPLLMGVMFLVIGVPMLIGAAAVPAAAGGLSISGILFLVLGGGCVFWAFRALKDIRHVEPDAPLPGSLSEQTATELATTGLGAIGTITDFKYVAGSTEEGTTLVALELDVSTGRGETVHMAHKSRMPLKLNERLVKGATVPVRVSTTDTSKILVEWDGLTAPTPPAPPAATPSSAPASGAPSGSAAP